MQSTSWRLLAFVLLAYRADQACSLSIYRPIGKNILNYPQHPRSIFSSEKQNGICIPSSVSSGCGFTVAENQRFSLLTPAERVGACPEFKRRRVRLQIRGSNVDTYDDDDDNFEESFARDVAWQASLQDALLDDDLLDSMQALNDKRAKSTTKSKKPAPELIYLDSRAPLKAKALKNQGAQLDLWAAHGVERTEIPTEWIRVDLSAMLGDGTYGEVYEAEVTGGPLLGARAVCKRAKDGTAADGSGPDPLVGVGPEDKENQELAARYLEIEALMNDLVHRACPSIAAPYLGQMRWRGHRWLVWQHAGVDTLESLLIESERAGHLGPLAKALGVEGYVDSDEASLQRLVNTVALELLLCCQALERAGVSHRDLKPYNILVRDRRLVLIDFGSAAAMGLPGRPGYDYNKSPCDPRYAPPEQFIDEEFWDRYDLYCVGLMLVRILFNPLWGGQHFDEFSDSYHEADYDLDVWLGTILRDEEGGASLLPLPRWRFSPLNTAKSRDQEYVDLADQSCRIPFGDERQLTLCSMKQGLEVLNFEGGGVCWDTLRQMLARDPARRIPTVEVLRRISKFKTWHAH